MTPPLTPRTLRLCANCLQAGAVPVDVGPDIGSQRDPYRAQLDLCPPCREALLTGNLGVLAGRYATERTVAR